MTAIYSVAGNQIVGERKKQEDSLCIVHDAVKGCDAESYLLVLADGMGGHAGGELASAITCDAVRDVFSREAGRIPGILRASVAWATLQLRERLVETPALQGMGTTLVAAVICGHELYWLSVGDSVLWLMREGKLIRLNEDHSMAPVLAEMAARGEISAKDAKNDLRRHHLRSVINGEKPSLLEVSEDPTALQDGDALILASDGITTLDCETLGRMMRHTAFWSSKRTVEHILKGVVSARSPGQDNASLIVAKFGDNLNMHAPAARGGWASALWSRLKSLRK